MAIKTRGLSRDANNEPAQFLTRFQCYDSAAGITNSSPLAYTTNALNLVVPPNAFEFAFNVTSIDGTKFQYSNKSSMVDYFEIVDGTNTTIPCSEIDNIYIKGATAGGTVNFRFNTV